MKTYACIDGGVVTEIIPPMVDADGNEIAIERRFHPDVVARLVDVTSISGIATGWTFGNGVFSAPVVAEPSLKDLKDAKNSDINAARLKANYTTFPHAGKVFACDNLSRSDIDAVANHIGLLGEFPPSFPGGWKAVDNTMLPMATVADFKAFYQSMTAQGAANFNHSQALKAQLAAAMTQEEVDAIVW